MRCAEPESRCAQLSRSTIPLLLHASSLQHVLASGLHAYDAITLNLARRVCIAECALLNWQRQAGWGTAAYRLRWGSDRRGGVRCSPAVHLSVRMMSVGGAPRLKEGRSNCERAGSRSSRGAERPGEKGGKRGLKSTDARARMTQGERNTPYRQKGTHKQTSACAHPLRPSAFSKIALSVQKSVLETALSSARGLPSRRNTRRNDWRRPKTSVV